MPAAGTVAEKCLQCRRKGGCFQRKVHAALRAGRVLNIVLWRVEVCGMTQKAGVLRTEEKLGQGRSRWAMDAPEAAAFTTGWADQPRRASGVLLHLQIAKIALKGHRSSLHSLHCTVQRMQLGERCGDASIIGLLPALVLHLSYRLSQFPLIFLCESGESRWRCPKPDSVQDQVYFCHVFHQTS